LNTYSVNPSEKATIEEINNLIIDSIQDIKGQNIVKLDLRKLDDAPADFFIICQGESSTQVESIAGNVQKRLKHELGVRPSNVEGSLSKQWVLVDYFNTVVHVFYPETRSFYELEDLWGDAEFYSYESI
jgi:ribosome-associated protein